MATEVFKTGDFRSETAKTEGEIVKTKDQLLKEMQAALDAKDFGLVSKVSRAIDKIVTGEEKTERDAKLASIVELETKVNSIIKKALKAMYEGKELDVADGVWFSWDFGTGELTTCRLLKGAVKKAGGGGGGAGKRVNVPTSELLKQHGGKAIDESGKTFQKAYDEDTGGNSRYKVRMKLLKAAGLS